MEKDAANCPNRNGCPSDRPFKCADGTCIDTKSSKCSISRCPSTTPYQCEDGVCGVDSSACNAYTKDIDKKRCIASQSGSTVVYGYFCADGRCVESMEYCRPVFECGVGQIKCGDGTCRSSGSGCPKENACPFEKPNITDIGKCYLEALEPQTQDCPVNFTKCNYTGHCFEYKPKNESNTTNITEYSFLKQYEEYFDFNNETEEMVNCPREFRPNGCPKDKPFRCTDGRCLSKDICDIINSACNEEEPYLCPNGKCVANNTECDDIQAGCESGKVPCSNGKCVNNISECSNKLGCQENKPYKCSNGDCVEYPKKCSANIECDSFKPVQCADGTCVTAAEECQKIYPCIMKNNDTYNYSRVYPCKNRIGVCFSEGNSSLCDVIEKLCPINTPIKVYNYITISVQMENVSQSTQTVQYQKVIRHAMKVSSIALEKVYVSALCCNALLLMKYQESLPHHKEIWQPKAKMVVQQKDLSVAETEHV